MRTVFAVVTAIGLGTGAASAATTTIDFEEFSAGDIITEVSAGGLNIGVTTNSNGSSDLGIIFDTNNVTGGDFDLGSPFNDGAGGILAPGNALIISDEGDTVSYTHLTLPTILLV